ncbi:hypothetical protein LTR85_000414 [Meristemomyces frigidus]|nr:hypothetical protein LTR85_000414 [Meristemomyces frigidus]
MSADALNGSMPELTLAYPMLGDQGRDQLACRLSLADFFGKGPSAFPAVPGEGRFSFMGRLGLNDRIPYHRHIFEQIKACILVDLCNQAMLMELLKIGVQIECMDLFDCPAVTPDAVDEAERRVYESASPETRCIYEVAPAKVDNWIVRWMLWHIIQEASELALSACSPPSPLKKHAQKRSGTVRFKMEKQLQQPSLHGSLTSTTCASEMTPVSLQSEDSFGSYRDPVRSA